MVEGGANEASEADMLDIFDLAHDAIKTLCAAMDSLRERCGVEKLEVAAPQELNADVVAYMKEMAPTASQSTFNLNKHERKDGLKAARDALIAEIVDGKDEDEIDALTADAKLLGTN